MSATQALAQMYASSRLYINYFQPSFKLKSKTRDGAQVHKVYHPPMTPCDRLLGTDVVSEATKAQLREQFASLDPVMLLQEIRAAQRVLADFATDHPPEREVTQASTDLATFLESLGTAWKEGEVRPTHCNVSRKNRENIPTYLRVKNEARPPLFSEERAPGGVRYGFYRCGRSGGGRSQGRSELQGGGFVPRCRRICAR